MNVIRNAWIEKDKINKKCGNRHQTFRLSRCPEEIIFSTFLAYFSLLSVGTFTSVLNDKKSLRSQ
jgi:hypothetical protein